jgi:integrase
VNLTAAAAAQCVLGAGETDRIWFDDAVPGFGLRVRDSGSRSWIFQYKIGRKTRRIAIGQATAVKVARAREIAGELHAKVKLGGDPAAEKRVLIERSSHTFGALAQRYLQQQKSEVRERTLRAIERALQNYAAPLHPLPVDAVDQRTIAERLSRIEKDSGAVTCNRVRATMSAMFTWGMREGLALANPVINTHRREERPRDRVLSDKELQLIWSCLPDNQYGVIVRLLVLTGQRVNEIGGLCWRELDFDRGVISLPGARTKNGRPHEVPMSHGVRGLLQAQTQSGELVFGNRRAGPFNVWSKAKSSLDAAIAEASGKALPHWVLHDIRRSVATGMADIGIQPHIIEAVLNHVSGHRSGVAGIYNRATYAKEKAEALARWDEHVKALVGGARSKVTPIRGRG